MRSSRVSTPSSSASPDSSGAASLASSLSSSSLLLLDAALLSTRSASLALLASLLLLSALLLSSLLLLLLLEAGGGGGGGAFLSFLRFFASLEASLSLFLPIVNASRVGNWRVAVGAAALRQEMNCRAREMNCDGMAQHSYDRFLLLLRLSAPHAEHSRNFSCGASGL